MSYSGSGDPAADFLGMLIPLFIIFGIGVGVWFLITYLNQSRTSGSSSSDRDRQKESPPYYIKPSEQKKSPDYYHDNNSDNNNNRRDDRKNRKIDEYHV